MLKLSKFTVIAEWELIFVAVWRQILELLQSVGKLLVVLLQLSDLWLVLTDEAILVRLSRFTYVAWVAKLEIVDFLSSLFVFCLSYLELASDSTKLVSLLGEPLLLVCDFFSEVCDVFVLHAELRAQLTNLPLKIVNDIFVSLFLLV